MPPTDPKTKGKPAKRRRIDTPQIDYSKLAAEILRQQSITSHDVTSTGVLSNSHQSNSHQFTAPTAINEANADLQIPTEPSPSGSSQSPQISDTSMSASNSASSAHMPILMHGPRDSQTQSICTITHPSTGTVMAPGRLVSCTSPSSSACATFTEQPSTSQPLQNVHTIIDSLFAGESPAEKPYVRQLQPVIQISDGIPLATPISQKIKDKIWADEYIDLASLTPNYIDDSVGVFVSKRRFSVYNNTPRFRTNLSIEQWTTAFLIFADIYIEKKPEESRTLLKYCHTIREMYDLYGDEPWRVYDERFRRLRETVKLPWGKLVDELYTKSANSNAQNNKAKQVASNFRPQQEKSVLPRQSYIPPSTITTPPTAAVKPKTCIQYNKGQVCRKPCPYKHACHFCSGSHPRFQCAEYKSILSRQIPSMPTGAKRYSNPNKSQNS